MITYRQKDMIVTGGFNVYPAEIECERAMHSDGALAAVGKRAEDMTGEVAVAYMVAGPGAR